MAAIRIDNDFRFKGVGITQFDIRMCLKPGLFLRGKNNTTVFCCNVTDDSGSAWAKAVLGKKEKRVQVRNTRSTANCLAIGKEAIFRTIDR